MYVCVCDTQKDICCYRFDFYFSKLDVDGEGREGRGGGERKGKEEGKKGEGKSLFFFAFAKRVF